LIFKTLFIEGIITINVKNKMITKDMVLGDVVQQYPDTVEVFMRYGLHCIGCHVAAFETIEQGAMAHGIEDVDALVKDLNKAVEEKK
jgi:hybrid cluster-associated redox disulfide protein